MKLKDKVAIITGAGKGIGKAYALRFAKEGAKVVIAEIKTDEAKATENEIVSQGGEALAIHTDVANEESTLEMAKETVRKLGRIDILVNNAAFYYGLASKPWDAWTLDEWHRSFTINVIGSWSCIKAVAPYMIDQRKGKIINISSATFDTGLPAFLPYTCTKGATVALTRVIARALGRYNINVNCISPGYTLSEGSLTKPGRTEEGDQAIIRSRCFRRHEYPEDLIGAAVFFASDDSDFITGQTLLVEGGEIMR